MGCVSTDMVGEIWSSAKPLKSNLDYGSVSLTPSGAFEARSYQTFVLTYTVGRFGMDDTGTLRVVFRFPLDSGPFQTSDPVSANYVTAQTNKGIDLSVSYNAAGHTRPRDRALTVYVSGGYLAEGDTIILVLGDKTGGGPGMKMQTFCETALEFKVLVDIYATGHYVPLPQTPYISIIPGKPVNWKIVAPSLRRPYEEFSLGIKVDDVWGNPSDQVNDVLILESNLPITNLPSKINFHRGQRSVQVDGLIAEKPDIYRIKIYNEDRKLLAESNPIAIKDSELAGYWGDLHGQTGETVAINTAREYFTFARDLAFLDVASHQGNDFQINNLFWHELNRLTAEFNQDGKFITFPGYEWSGNTAVGGDHNVYFRHENRPIFRSSHALLIDRSDIDTDANTSKELFERLSGEDCVVYAHVGGRYADISYAHDPRIETSMEIHSAWGTFEWLIIDSFRLNYRCGVVCNSDGHKGRPGASHPGAASFGTYGGLTCFLAPELNRDSIFECIRRRHHYGTSGNRIHLDVRAIFRGEGQHFDKDPKVFAIKPNRVDRVMMGDIAQTNDKTVDLFVEAVCPAPIERIEVLNGEQLVHTLRGYTDKDLGNRIRVIWSGAKYRGRGRKTIWKGSAIFEKARIIRMEKINEWNPELSFFQEGENQVVWDVATTGNFGGFDVWLDTSEESRLKLSTNIISANLLLKGIGLDDIVFDAGGLNQCIKVFRLPENNQSYALNSTVPVKIRPVGDNPLWVRVTTEDGFNAWSSPIFLYNEEG
jgi:hypothetical protein